MNDVLVIGGGPAGSATAIRLAQQRMRVTLYEKARFPRPKLCGGFLSGESLSELDDLGVLDTLYNVGARSIHRTIVSSASGAQAETCLPLPGLSISRHRLDAILMNRARESGVNVHEGEDGHGHIGEANWTIMATGRTPHLYSLSPSKGQRVGVRG